jgi:hypothetical protein
MSFMVVGVPVAALLKLPQWDAATRHPFLRAVGEETASTFGVWLAQDALFVANLVAFQARLVAFCEFLLNEARADEVGRSPPREVFDCARQLPGGSCPA